VTPFRDVYPPGLYGRAWVTGCELAAAIGWERLKGLAQSLDEHGRPDVGGWVDGLVGRQRNEVERVLGVVDATWV